jgi:outer membrane protein assembly factor BamB
VHPLYQSNGTPFENPIPFLPPNASVRGVNLFDNTLYAATTEACDGQKEAVYALDLASEDKTVRRFDTSAGAQGSAGPAVGNDGTVYAHTAGRIVALTEKELKEKDHFAMAAAAGRGTTPLVFEHNDKDLVVAGAGGDIYVLDSAALGGKDHRTPLARARVEGTVRGALASWEDPETGVRWIFAPVWGDGDRTGAIAAFTYEDGNGRAALTERWMARGIAAPAAPAIANGLVFALATGDNPRLDILDAASGKQLFTSRDQVAGAAGAETGLAVANGRVYFSTLDNVVYCFGIPTEH